MSRKDKMIEQSDCVEAIFLSYIQQKSSQKMILFFEGKDDFKYYCPRIHSIYNEKHINYNCNGKENVLKIYNMIIEKTVEDRKVIKMFFVDKDYDDNSNIDTNDIYITPTYSIENLYFTDFAIESMIRGEMGLSAEAKDDTQDFKIAYDYIREWRDKIIKEILYGNACYSLQIKKSHGKNCKKPSLTAIKKYNDIVSIAKLEDIKVKLKETYIKMTEEEIKEEYERLKSDPIKFIRGKYLFEKMPKYINKIVEESNKGIEYDGHFFSKKRIMRLNTSELTLISDLSNYAETPRCLQEYIKKCVTLYRN